MKGCAIVGVPISMGMIISILICGYAVVRYYYPVVQTYLW